MTSIPIPDRMAHLPVDARGYPVPCMVQVDDAGVPHFAVNNEAARRRVLALDLCAICGGKLLRGRWFVGGLKSALHPNGAFIDPPLHRECCLFALQVCPYLCAPSWVREVGVRKWEASVGAAGVVGVIDPTMLPDRPAVFVACMAIGQHLVNGNGYQDFVVPKRPYRRVEFWQLGKRLNDADGAALCAVDLQCSVDQVWALTRNRFAIRT